MKIGVFQDVHANLPAFSKALQIFEEQACDKIFHVGDLIGIGPHPKEVFELAIQQKNMIFIMGNHDYWYGYGIPKPLPKYMNEEEYEHQMWNHKQLGEAHRKKVQKWKFVETLRLDDIHRFCFMHYGYDEQTNWLREYVKEPNAERLDLLFDNIDADVIFYGHDHEASDITGSKRYINLGSAGCNDKALVRVGILDVKADGFQLEKIEAAYDDNGLMEDFDLRGVPARDFIRSNFIVRSQ